MVVPNQYVSMWVRCDGREVCSCSKRDCRRRRRGIGTASSHRSVVGHGSVSVVVRPSDTPVLSCPRDAAATIARPPHSALCSVWRGVKWSARRRCQYQQCRGCRDTPESRAPIAGEGTWSPLEEALYWGQAATVQLLVERGAPVDNLRKRAALGDVQGVERCFDGNGRVNEKAGEVAWPFGDISTELRRDHRQIVNNALVFSAAWGQTQTADELLTRRRGD